MRKAFIFILIFCSAIPYIHSQGIKLGVNLSTGLGAGWWVYNKGFSQDGWHNGYDRTHLAFSLPIEAELQAKHDRWEILLGAGMRRLVDNVMIGSDHQRTNRSRYLVSEETFLRFRHIHLGLGYTLIQRPSYHLIPSVRLGTFWFQHTHPAAANMGRRLSMDIGIAQRWRLSNRWNLIAEGRYSDWRIWGNSQALRSEQHHIYTIDLRMGFLIWIIDNTP